MTNCEQLEAVGNQSMTLVCEAIMASRGGIPREARILDFGCGQGGMSGSSAALATRWSASTGSPRSFATARSIFTRPMPKGDSRSLLIPLTSVIPHLSLSTS